MIRQPIITVLGHVDHGKTSVLDYVRQTTLAKREAGLITQHIGATEIPLDVIQKVCGPLLERFKMKFTIPGLLMIDTPGHEAFTNLRKRGGSIADMAIVIIDIMQGVQPQTKEAIDILKTFKVPFIVAANKIDLLAGWKPHSNIFIQNFEKQLQTTKDQFENRFYKLVGQLSALGFDSDMYDKVENYKEKIAIVPISAKTGEGIPELIAILTGLSQKFLEGKLKIEPKDPAKGSILEIKEEKGLGLTADIIIYDGTLKVGDIIVVGGTSGAIMTKIKIMLKPAPLSELRDIKSKWKHIDSAYAATGVKIVAPDMEKAVAGAPLMSVKMGIDAENIKKEIESEVESILIETETSGIVLKTDTLGSLEAVSEMLKQKNIPLQRAAIGNINRTDIMTASATKDPLLGFVLGFNVKIDDDARILANNLKVPVIIDNVIYNLMDKYEKQVVERKKQIETAKLAGLTWPAKFKILPGYVFRQSHPAVFGVEVIAGKLRPKVSIMTKEAKILGEIKTIESEGTKLEELKVGVKAAISVEGITIGRQAKEGDILYVAIDELAFKKLKERKELLSQAEINILKEIAEVKRKDKATWGL